MTSNWALGKETGFILSLVPGEYDFLLSVGTAEEKVHVRVEDSKMTPVRISYPLVATSNKSTNSSTITTTNFKILLTVEPMQPLK